MRTCVTHGNPWEPRFTLMEANQIRYFYKNHEWNHNGKFVLDDPVLNPIEDKLISFFLDEMPYDVLCGDTGIPLEWISEKFAYYNEADFEEWLTMRTESLSLLVLEDIRQYFDDNLHDCSRQAEDILAVLDTMIAGRKLSD